MAELNGMQGNEIADDFNINSVPGGRWGYTWGVFKSNFWRLVVLNILMLVTVAPAIGVMIFRSAYIVALGGQYPFNSGVAYPFYPPEIVTGLAEKVTLSVDMLAYAALILAGFIASVGFSGASYCIRKLLQGGEFNMKSFFHGVKVGYFNTLLPLTLFLVFFYGAVLGGDWMHVVGATGGNYAAAVTAYVFIIIVTVLAGLYLAWVFAVGVSYRVKLSGLIRNSFLLLIGTPLQTIFMAAFSLIPVWLLIWFVSMSLSGNILFGFIAMLGFILLILIGISFILLCWLSFAQWVFDIYIAPPVKAKETKVQKTPQQLQAEKAEAERVRALELLAAGKSDLIARPIMPIPKEQSVTPLGKTFTRAGIRNAANQREILNTAVANYEEYHKNDPEYAEYNKMFADREKSVADPAAKKGKKSKKRISAENLLR